jgi:integrase
MTFQEQSETWFAGLATRKRAPVKPGSLRTYRSYLDSRILPRIGKVELTDFGNAAMKKFVSSLSRSGLSIKTQTEIISLTKQLVASALTPEGEQIYPRNWNNDFLDTPIVESSKQKTPSATAEQVFAAIQGAEPQYRTLWALLGGTALRIGEARAMKYGNDGIHSAWDPEKGVAVVRRAIYRGLEQSPKTAAGTREVDLPTALNQYLKDNCVVKPGEYMFPQSESLLRKHLKKTGIDGFHAYRRFCISHWENFGVPQSVTMFWSGHAAGTVHEKYIKVKENIEMRKQWIERAGLGFELPKTEEKV